MGRPIKKGSTDQSTVIRIIDSTAGTPENAVEYDTSGIDLWFRREKETKTSITEAALAALDSAHSDGGIELIGDGYYRLDLPDASVAAGSGENSVQIGGTITGMIVIGNEHALVDYDPYDAVRAGLTALPNAAADAAGGLPISDAGGLDLDGMDTDIDDIETDTGTTLDAMLVSIDNFIDTEIAAIVAAVITNAAGADVAADIIALKTEADKIGTIPALDGGAQTIGAAIAKLADDNGGADFDAGTDSLQEIRDRGDAAWAGAPEACSGTFEVNTADTIFDLTATLGTLWASDDDVPPENMIICMYDDSADTYETRRITAYSVEAGPIYRVTLDRDLNFPGEDGVDTWVIYRNAYAPVGEASVSDANMNTIADKVWDEADKDHMTQGTKGLKMHHAGKGRY